MDTEPTTQHVLQGRELIDYLVEKAATTTNAELIAREERRNRRSTVLFSIVTFVGISGLVGAAQLFIDNAVQQRTNEFRDQMARSAEQLERRIAAMHLESQTFQKLINDQISALEQGMQQQVKMHVAEEASRGLLLLKQREQFHSLKQFVGEIREQMAENHFSENLLTAAIDTACHLATAPSIVEEPEYRAMMETLIHQLVRYDRMKDIERIEAATRATCIQSKSIALDLTDHYGQLIVSSPYPVDQLQSEWEALTRYARASRELKYPERSLMWELFVEFKRAKFIRSPGTDEIVEMIHQLEPIDLRSFAYFVFLYSDPLHWEHRPDHEGRTLAKLVAGLLQAHPELDQTIRTQMATPELRANVDQLSAVKAERQQRLDELHQSDIADEKPAETATHDGESNTLRF